MSDYSEQGAQPVEDAAVAHPPTVDEVLEQQAEKFPEQARTAVRHRPLTAQELAVVEAGGDVVEDQDDVAVEGPNSA